MNQHSRWNLLPAFYALGGMLILIPAIELIITSWPAQPALLNWRFGLLGLIANSLLFPSIGLGILLLTAERSGHRGALLGLGTAGVAGCLFLITGLGTFALDVVQLRSLVAGPARVGYDAVVAKASINLLIAAVVWGWAGYLGIRAALGMKSMERASKASNPPLRPRKAAQTVG
ncbi:MAG: hypothetical protein H0U67_13830 [Gemmatimonadetes bacterium]|nr:hypothetical protein [Gemmatimonadota bacterium]